MTPPPSPSRRDSVSPAASDRPAYPPITGDEPCRQVDADVFFPESGENELARAAAKLCRSCDVLLPCLAYAVANEPHGIWAGTSPKQRQRLRRMSGVSS